MIESFATRLNSVSIPPLSGLVSHGSKSQPSNPMVGLSGLVSPYLELSWSVPILNYLVSTNEGLTKSDFISINCQGPHSYYSGNSKDLEDTSQELGTKASHILNYTDI